MIKLPIKYKWYNFVTKIHRFLVRHTPLPICQGADSPCFKYGKKRRQNTRYVDDSRNWVVLCDKCAAINAEYWADMWADYYSEVM